MENPFVFGEIVGQRYFVDREKELQNLVQFGVVKPQRSAGTYFFDMDVLLAAKVALHLKELLGTRTNVLSRLMDAFSASEEDLRKQNPNYVGFNCRLTSEEEPIKLAQVRHSPVESDEF